MSDCIHVFKNGKYTIKVHHNEMWLLLFRHVSTKAGLFKDTTEAQYSLDENKYSILSELKRLPKINSSYEFLLEYPLISSSKHNR